MQSNKVPKNTQPIKNIKDIVKAGIWDGLTEQETNQTLLLKILVAFSISLATPLPPLLIASIPVVGLKRIGKGSYHLGTSLFTLFQNYSENKATEAHELAIPNGSFNNH